MSTVLPLKPIYVNNSIVKLGEFQSGDLIDPVYTGVVKENYIINPCFEINQRVNASVNSNGAFPVDRWKVGFYGSSIVASQQSFTVGQTDVPGEPKNFLRAVVTSVAGAGYIGVINQAIESVRTLAGKTVTLSFMGKADSSKPIAIEFVQYFGSGGSPSATVTGIGSTKISLTPSWSTQKVTVDIPSIAGKTVGTNGDDYLQLQFVFDAGSDFNARTCYLGQQSGTFDLANVKLEEGSVVTPCIVPQFGEELWKCQRYGMRIALGIIGEFSVRYGTIQVITFLNLSQSMRSTPTLYSSSPVWVSSSPSGNQIGFIDYLTSSFITASGSVTYTIDNANLGNSKLRFVSQATTFSGNAGDVGLLVFGNTAFIFLDSEL